MTLTHTDIAVGAALLLALLLLLYVIGWHRGHKAGIRYEQTCARAESERAARWSGRAPLKAADVIRPELPPTAPYPIVLQPYTAPASVPTPRTPETDREWIERHTDWIIHQDELHRPRATRLEIEQALSRYIHRHALSRRQTDIVMAALEAPWHHRIGRH